MAVLFPGGATLPATLPERALFVHTPGDGDPKLYTGPAGGGAPVAVAGSGSAFGTWPIYLYLDGVGGFAEPPILPPGYTANVNANEEAVDIIGPLLPAQTGGGFDPVGIDVFTWRVQPQSGSLSRLFVPGVNLAAVEGTVAIVIAYPLP